MARLLSEIASEAIRDKKIWSGTGAEPYLSAMRHLNSVDDMYGMDSGASIVRYFLANAGTWRGETARRIKAELKGLLGER